MIMRLERMYSKYKKITKVLSLLENRNNETKIIISLAYQTSKKSVAEFVEYMKISFMGFCKLRLIM
jgi:hypothetical protein